MSHWANEVVACAIARGDHLTTLVRIICEIEYARSYYAIPEIYTVKKRDIYICLSLSISLHGYGLPQYDTTILKVVISEYSSAYYMQFNWTLNTSTVNSPINNFDLSCNR